MSAKVARGDDLNMLDNASACSLPGLGKMHDGSSTVAAAAAIHSGWREKQSLAGKIARRGSHMGRCAS